MQKQALAPVLLAATTVVCAAVAAVTGRPAWAAALGAGLVIVYWALEAAMWKRVGRRQGLALGTAVGGMVLRLGVILAALIAVAVLDRSAFATTVIAFVAAFTVYLPVRFLTYPDAGAPARRARAS